MRIRNRVKWVLGIIVICVVISGILAFFADKVLTKVVDKVTIIKGEPQIYIIGQEK